MICEHHAGGILAIMEDLDSELLNTVGCRWMVQCVDCMTSVPRCLYPLKRQIQGGNYGEVEVI